MTFGYVGYVWAILCCGSIALFLGALGVALYVVGKRRERGAPRLVVESIAPARAAATTPSRGEPSGDDAA